MREKSCFYMEYNLQWFAKEGNGGEKTEPATSKKLQDARNEGQVAKSQELNSALSLIALFVTLKLFISYIGESLLQSFPALYRKIPDVIDESIGGMSVKLAVTVINNTLGTIVKILLPVFFNWVFCCIADEYCPGWMEGDGQAHEAQVQQTESFKRL